MKKITVSVLSAGLAIAATVSVFGLTHPAKVMAQQKGCSVSTAQGNYGYSFSGWVTLAPGAVVPVAGAGRVTADGAGNAAGADTFSVNGLIIKRTYTGTYTVNADCTGSAIYQDAQGLVFHEDIVVMDNSNQIAVVVTDPGAVLSFVDVRQ